MSTKTLLSVPINRKTLIQIAVAAVPVVFCVYFIRKEGPELGNAMGLIRHHSSLFWIGIGLIVTIAYIMFNALMYYSSFQTLKRKISFSSTLLLYLKRNFISVFLPAGGFSSLAFFTSAIEEQGVPKTTIYLASSLYGLCGFVSLIFVSVPAIIVLFMSNSLTSGIIIPFVVLTAIVVSVWLIFRSLMREGYMYRLFTKLRPGLIILLEDLKAHQFDAKYIIVTVLYSLGIEVTGMAHVYIAMHAFGLPCTFQIALVGYVVATLMFAVSPFMRGVGAVEITLTVVLVKIFHVDQVQAISVSILYRFFEFWVPLLIGALSFFVKRQNTFLRIVPAFFVLLLGMVNIFSVLTPPIAERLDMVKAFLPDGFIPASNYVVITAGLVMIALSAFLLRGLRNAWVITLILSVLSVIGHLTKAIDYEEAIYGVIVTAILLYTRKAYVIRSDARLWHTSKLFILLSFLFIVVYGTIGFYLLDFKHFGADYNWGDSFIAMFKTAFLFQDGSLIPNTSFAYGFMYSLNGMGLVFFLYIIYMVIKPAVFRHNNHIDEIKHAKDIVEKAGKSQLDYFKYYRDKLFYFTDNGQALVSFKNSDEFAIVLESPVCEDKTKIPEIIDEFEDYCSRNGLKTLYYRVDETDLPFYEDKKSILIGQEGIIDIENFSLAGGDKKSIRNGIKKVETLGYACKTYEPPLNTGFVQKLKSVSSEWLHSNEKEESVFSQGAFDEHEIAGQIVFVVENNDGKILAFANIIPDFAPFEGTYDLIRKTNDAPGGVLDCLLVNMIEHFRGQGKKYLNIGLAPLSGIEKAGNLPERTIKFAYENMRRLSHLKGMRFFKEKYATIWHNKYLIYSNGYDLLQAPIALNKVSKM